ncbi:hypothetical protein [Pseudomonas putida]|uniref:hypothetical protein n=1 Tax=Pseudomonas putida TaxID=303 RepID=UPI003D99141D
MTTKNSIEGHENILVGGDLVIHLSPAEQADMFNRFFSSADQRFKDEISETGKIFRISGEIEYSTEKIFTSLLQLGIPADIAIKVPLHIIDLLRDVLDTYDDKHLVTTADVRAAVVLAIEGLPLTGRFTSETTSMWAAAYIRRYGNPEYEFVKVLDHGTARDLDYNFISSELLPHILSRILDVPRNSDSEKIFSQIFSATRTAAMSTEIMRLVNTLNLYSIRYKTLLFLVQDLVLEPPHPWLVTSDTQKKVVEYNIFRMHANHQIIGSTSASRNLALLEYSHQEFFRHAGTAILALYGAFLGVGSSYGLAELTRMLSLKHQHFPLWSHCEIRSIEPELQALGTTVSELKLIADGALAIMRFPSSNGSHLLKLEGKVKYFFDLVTNLVNTRLSMD